MVTKTGDPHKSGYLTIESVIQSHLTTISGRKFTETNQTAIQVLDAQIQL